MDQIVGTEAESVLANRMAAATRTLNHLGILGYSGHIGARLPGKYNLLIQPFDRSRAEVRPQDLIMADFDGKSVRGPEGARLPDEVFIHTEILKARPDVMAVLHFHPDIATIFTLVDGIELKPMKNHAARWASGIPVHGEAAKIVDAEMGRRLAGTLAAHHAALMRAHGAVLVAESVEALMIDAIHFVENAETMYKAAMLGPVKPLTEAEMATIGAKTSRPKHVGKLWRYYCRGAVAAGVIPEEWL